VFYSADLGFFGEKKAITGIALQDARIELAGCPHRPGGHLIPEDD
jgi:hypothetical protein